MNEAPQHIKEASELLVSFLETRSKLEESLKEVEDQIEVAVSLRDRISLALSSTSSERLEQTEASTESPDLKTPEVKTQDEDDPFSLDNIDF